jgi:hypothetical protein
LFPSRFNCTLYSNYKQILYLFTNKQFDAPFLFWLFYPLMAIKNIKTLAHYCHLLTYIFVSNMNNKIGICCFSAKHAALRRKSKDWLVGNQDNVSEWGDMSIRKLLFRWARTIKIQLCWSSTKRTWSSFHWKLSCSCHDRAEKLLSRH